MNIMIPFRDTCGTHELEMCIRLIKKNFKIAYNKIYVIGDCYVSPDVVNIIVEEQKYNKWIDSGFLVDYYIKNIGEPFILFNDDFFITAPVNELPAYYFSQLSKRILTTYVIDKTNKLRLSTYGLNIKQFIDMIGDADNYEVHIPLIVEYPDKMSEAIKICKDNDFPALKRTMYMKLIESTNPVKKELPHDIKYGEPLHILQYPFFSLTDTEFNAFRNELMKI